MKSIDDKIVVQSGDGSATAYSKVFGEHYHSTKEGALAESLNKHVVPALLHVSDKESITILDICFGLGYNTLATLYWLKKESIKKRVRIISPEFDGALVASLRDFAYPKEFAPFKKIVTSISESGEYRDEQLHITVVIDDARRYLLTCNERFDIVYHDAFSPAKDPALWTLEYFADIARLLSDDGILTTYSTAYRTRLALHRNGFLLYINEGESYRNATLATKRPIQGYKVVDMAHKISCNGDIEPLRDRCVGKGARC